MGLWDMQKSLVVAEKVANKNYVKQLAQEGLNVLDTNSAALHENATRNGELQPLYAVRTKPKECKIAIKTGDEIYAGDYIEVFNETWIVISTYEDECDIKRATAYICNHLFKFQNETSEIYSFYGVIDDGNYSSRNDKELPLAQGSYKGYLPINPQTEKIFINKRFALDTIYDQDLKQILSVVEVVWVDKQSGNLNKGDHLLKMRLEKDEYQSHLDDVENRVCNYKANTEPEVPTEPDEPETPPTTNLRCVIAGASSIRLGNARDYTVSVLDENDNIVDSSTDIFVWEYETIAGIAYTETNNKLNVKVSTNTALMGRVITIKVIDTTANYAKASFDIELM